MYILKKSVQYKDKYYRRGDKIKIADKDIDEFIRRKLVMEPEVVKETIPQARPKEPAVDLIDYEEFTVPELKEMLNNKDIKYKSSDTKAELINLLRGE